MKMHFNCVMIISIIVLALHNKMNSKWLKIISGDSFEYISLADVFWTGTKCRYQDFKIKLAYHSYTAELNQLYKLEKTFVTDKGYFDKAKLRSR